MAINIKDKYTRWFAIGVVLMVLSVILSLIPGILFITWVNNGVSSGLFTILTLLITGYVIENWLGKVINVKMKR